MCTVASMSLVKPELEASSDCTVDATDSVPTGDGISSNSCEPDPVAIGSSGPSNLETVDLDSCDPNLSLPIPSRSLPTTDSVESTTPDTDPPMPDEELPDIPPTPSCSRSTHGNGLRCPTVLAGKALSMLELPKLASALVMNSRVEPSEGSGEWRRLINGNARNGRRIEPVLGRPISAPLSELGLGSGRREVSGALWGEGAYVLGGSSSSE